MYNTKAGLMGALAGIGDAIDSGTVQYIFIAIAVPWAQQGSALGALFPFVFFAIYQAVLGVFFARQSFTMGRNATGLMQSTGVQTAIEALSVLGLFMMGILAGNYVKVESTLKFAICLTGIRYPGHFESDRARDFTFGSRNGCLLVLYEERSESNTSTALVDANLNYFSRNWNLIKSKKGSVINGCN